MQIPILSPVAVSIQMMNLTVFSQGCALKMPIFRARVEIQNLFGKS